MKKDKFEMQKIFPGDKNIVILETGEDYYTTLNITIDYDDVSHPAIKEKVKRLLEILNEHF